MVIEGWGRQERVTELNGNGKNVIKKKENNNKKICINAKA